MKSRWTSKEAAFKALFPALKISWKDIKVVKQEAPKPVMSLLSFKQDANSSEDLDRIKLHLSVSHDGDYVASVVLAERDG